MFAPSVRIASLLLGLAAMPAAAQGVADDATARTMAQNTRVVMRTPKAPPPAQPQAALTPALTPARAPARPFALAEGTPRPVTTR
jgi:hypothetical protein